MYVLGAVGLFLKLKRYLALVAFQGYVEPRQSDAEVYFIRSKLEDGREAINEIRLVSSSSMYDLLELMIITALA